MSPDHKVLWGGGGGQGLGCVPLAAPMGLSPPLIRTLCGPERALVVSTEPPDDLSCLTTAGVGRPGDRAVARAVDQGHPDAPSESVRGFADSSTGGRGGLQLGTTSSSGVQSKWSQDSDTAGIFTTGL